MSISKADVRQVARLAHLYLDEKETEGMQKDMNSILEYAKRLDTVGVETTSTENKNTDKIPLRSDTPESWLQPGEATSSAPGAENNLFKVPPAIGGDQE